MDHLLNILSFSPKLFLGNPQKNMQSHLDCLEQLGGCDPEIILFPELSISGYSCGDLFHNKGFLDTCKQAALDLVEQTTKCRSVLVFGCPLEFDQKLYNCALIAYRGEVIQIIPKTHLPNYNEFYEVRWFSSAKNIAQDAEVTLGGQLVKFGQTIFQFETGERFAIEICEDLWSNCAISDTLFRNGAHVVLNLSASNELIGKADYRRDLVSNSSARNLGGYCYCSSNSGESSSELVYSGHKLSAELGKILTDRVDFQDEMSAVETQFDIQKIDAERRRMNTFIQENTIPVIEISKTIITKSEKLFPEPAQPFLPANPVAITEVHNVLNNILKFGLMRRITHVNAATAVIGISGGLDSTLALLTLVTAFKGLNRSLTEIHAVSMPGPGTGKRTRQNARTLAVELGCKFSEIDISEMCSQHTIMIEKDASEFDRTYENIQARIRTLTLMSLANENNGIVIGTGDLSEAALGWCTYSGDHISMYHVNGGVPKTLVRFMVEEYAKLEDFLCVKETLIDIVDTPISPELLPMVDGELTQQTEELIGNYELNDFFLFYFVRYGFPRNKLLDTAIQSFGGRFSKIYIEDTLDKFLSRFFSNQFKRNNGTEGPKIGSVNLSPRGDWRMPSDIIWKS